MTRLIRVLHLEDSPRDAEMLHDLLEAGGLTVDIVLVNSKEGFETALEGEAFDLILSDYNVPGYDGMAAVQLARDKRPETPVIVVSGTVGEEEAVKCLHLGATDYLLKERLERLVPAAQRAVREAEERRRRAQAEAKLHESERRFRLLAEQSDQCFWFVELNPPRVLYVSPAVETMWGRPVVEFYQDADLWFKAIHPDDAARVGKQWEAALQSPASSFEMEFRVVRPDGSVCWVTDRGTLIRNELGARTMVSGVASDITDRKRAEQLEVESAHKSWFLASMSHELRTPLNSILGFAELLQDPDFGSLDERQHKFVANIHTSGAHLLALINDILDLSKIAAGRIELHLEPVNVHEVLQGIGDILRPLTGRKRLTFTVHPVDAGLQVLADAARLKQVLYNLISNAIKFTPAGGHVDVRAVALPDAVQVSVADDGIGIAEADQERIFEEFQQVDSALSRQVEGTGLGLALTRNFVRLQGGGDIHVASAPGQGSTFTFTLPRSIATGAARPDVRPADVAGRARPTILLIEDDARARETFTLHLTREGYDVLHATNGEDGVRKARDSRPFAIVLEIRLPRTDGWDVLTELKANAATKAIPVILVSVADNHLLGFSLGVAGYLTKPVHRSDLIAAVKRLSLTTKARHRRVPVLIVDDDPQARDLVVAAFEPYGFELLTAGSGREALRLVAEAHPDLVVLDLMMPGVNGFEVVDAMKADPATAEIPVVVLSAKDLSPDERERLNSQVTTRLDKHGLSPQQLVTELRKLEEWFPLKPPIIDGLTALYNAVYFDKRLREEVARGQRDGRPFSVVVVGIDRFGEFTAAHGLEQGERALQQFGRLLEVTLRGADPVARLGGDVFGVLLPDSPGAAALEAAEQLRARVQDEVFLLTDGAPARLTVSVGLASYPVDGTTLDALTHAARTALEKARALNYNRVVAASPRTADTRTTA